MVETGYGQERTPADPGGGVLHWESAGPLALSGITASAGWSEDLGVRVPSSVPIRRQASLNVARSCGACRLFTCRVIPKRKEVKPVWPFSTHPKCCKFRHPRRSSSRPSALSSFRRHRPLAQRRSRRPHRALRRKLHRPPRSSGLRQLRQLPHRQRRRANLACAMVGGRSGMSHNTS